MTELRILTLALAVALGASCSTTPKKIDDAIPQAQLHPLRLLPPDAFAYARVTPGGWRDLRALAAPILARVDRRHAWNPDGFDMVTLALLAAMDPLLTSNLEAAGYDATRPTWIAFLSADTERLERIVSTGGVVEAADLPDAFHTVVLFPTTDAPALTTHLERWWSQTSGSLTGLQHRFEAASGYVRFDLVAMPVPGAVRPQALETARARNHGTQLRLTPAIAELVAGAGDAALYLPLDRLRPIAAVLTARSMFEAVANVNPLDVDIILTAGSSELTQQWLFLDPVGAEFEDVLLTLDIEPARSAELRTTATLTELGRKVARARTGVQSLPAFAEGPYLVDVVSAGAFGQTIEGVPLPRVVRLREKTGASGDEAGLERLAREYEVAGVWAYLGLLRGPTSWATAALALQPERKDTRGPVPDALHVRVLPLTSMTGDILQNARAAAVFQFRDDFTADAFISELQTKYGERLDRATVERLPTAPDGKARVFVGLNLGPADAFAGAQKEEVLTGLHTVVAADVLKLAGGILRLPTPWFRLIEQGPLAVTASYAATAVHSTLRLGAPPAAKPVAPVELSFTPVSHVVEEGDCRARIAAAGARALDALATKGPPHQASLPAALAEFDRVARCAGNDARLQQDVAVTRARFEPLAARLDSASRADITR